VAALFFALMVVVTVLHLVFAMPVPYLELNPVEWHRVRLSLAFVVLLNYAWVVVNTKFPHLLL
jgi:hypothetical protein